MRIVSQLRSWLRNILRRSRAECDMDSELRSHLEARADDLLRSGLSREEALRRARIEFGAIENFKEECREAKGANILESLLQDLRFALRMLRKSPGFTAVAVLTLALGIGANTAVFSVVNAVLLRPLPYKDSSRLYGVSLHSPMFPTFNLGLSWTAFQQIRSQATALEESAVYSTNQKTLTGDGNPALLEVADVSDGFFEQLGARPQLGRLLTEQDAKLGETSVVVLSDKLWRTRFGADPAIIGRKLVLDKNPVMVVGVVSPGFSYPQGEEAWSPLVLSDQDKQNQISFMLQFVGRLRRDHSLEQLQSQLSAVAHRIVADHPEVGEGYSFIPERLLDGEVENIRPAYFVLLGAATLVLLIACANLASLLLARGTGRRREMAMRAALGASRFRLLRQGLVESSLLAILGGALGVLLAVGGVWLFTKIAPADTPRLVEVSIDSTLLWFSFLASLAAGVVFGIAPARRASRSFPNEALKEASGAGAATSRSASQTRLGNILVVIEVALAFVLLVGSALMVQTVSRLLHQETGFRTDHLLTFDLLQQPTAQPSDKKKILQQSNERLDRIFERLRAVPGVTAVTAASHALLGGMSMMMSDVAVEGAIPERVGVERHATARYVDSTYFRALGIPLLRGRDFSPRPGDKSPSEIIVNESMARAYWNTLEVLGKRVSFSRDEKRNRIWSEVLAVVADSREIEVSMKPAPAFYVSMRQTSNGSFTVLLRTQTNPELLAGTISSELWSLFPDQPVSHVNTMTQVIAESVGDRKLRSILLIVFAGVGFALALVGAYGVISFSVSRRVQEIGVRMALGARSANVLRMILLQGLLLVSVGVAIGAAAAFGLTRLLASQLYGVKPTDPATFVGAAVLVVLVACAACLIPARRASRVDPIVALRYE